MCRGVSSARSPRILNVATDLGTMCYHTGSLLAFSFNNRVADRGCPGVPRDCVSAPSRGASVSYIAHIGLRLPDPKIWSGYGFALLSATYHAACRPPRASCTDHTKTIQSPTRRCRPRRGARGKRKGVSSRSAMSGWLTCWYWPLIVCAVHRRRQSRVTGRLCGRATSTWCRCERGGSRNYCAVYPPSTARA